MNSRTTGTSIPGNDLLSHHAQCLIGGASIHGQLVTALEKRHKLKTHGNPDFFDQTYQTFTIDDARAVKSLASTKPVGQDGHRIFILAMNGITLEAQNALLKLLEEPGEQTHFFLLIPSAHLLIPTVRSRISFVSLNGRQGRSDSSVSVSSSDGRYNIYNITAAQFIKLPTAKRLDLVKKLMEDIGKEKRPKQDALDFLNVLEETVYSSGGAAKNTKALEAIETARMYMNDRAPSLKMLLEYAVMSV